MQRAYTLALLLLGAGLILAQRPDTGPSPRPNPEREAALQEIVPVTFGLREDDHPAVASRGGDTWIAWVSYAETEHATRVFLRAYEGGKWKDAMEISETPGDYYKPTAAVDAGGNLWVAWPAQVAGNWDIYGRVRKGGSWSKTERWSEHPGPDMVPALAASGDRVMLVWQGMRKGNLDILYRLHSGGKWGAEAAVTENPANDWEPQVAATSDGAFHVAWDSYRSDYDVLYRSFRNNQWSAETAVAQTPKLENHVSLSADGQGRLWMAWEIGPEQWAGDSANGGLRARRDVGLACLRDGKMHRMPDAEAALVALGGESGMEAPVAVAGRDGRLRLFFRQPMNKNWLSVGMTAWEGGAWSKPEMLLYSEGRIDQRVITADLGSKVLAAYPAGSSHNIIYARLYDVGAAGSGAAPSLTASGSATPKAAPAALRRYERDGYQVIWGDLHRHTDISEDGGLIDGSLVDAMRYSLDAAGLDFIGVTDHTRYLPRRYNLWRIQQVSDVYYKPGSFAPVHAYERSQFTPWGHRNIVNLNRNYEPVPAAYDIGDAGVNPWGLFQALRGKNALSIPHTSAWGNKQVSWDYYDPEIERIVEIYQGLRSTYEYNGAPDPADRAVYEKDSKNFVWDALARKRKLGFIASSDHRSTHMSFAALYVKNVDRESIFEALKARRTYAATDKIIVDVSLSNAWMGAETAVPGQPELKVKVEGTGDLDRIDIIKDGTFVYTTRPTGPNANFTFRDEKYQGGDSYYYVRIIQKDKNMAWASPIWVRRGN